MKKTLLLIACFCLFQEVSFGQQFFMEVYSGYHMPNYDHEDYETEDYSQSGYSPIGIRIAGGHEYVQLGVEYRQNLTNPEFEMPKLPGSLSSFKETYYGGILRINISSLPVYRAGIILKAGAGYYTYTQDIDLGAGVTGTYEFDKKFGFNGGIGLSAPIYANLHLELGYSYHFIDRDAFSLEGFESFPGAEGYKAGYHAIQAGLSINLMVTEKGKKGCKNRRHKKGGKQGRKGWYK